MYLSLFAVQKNSKPDFFSPSAMIWPKKYFEDAPEVPKAKNKGKKNWTSTSNIEFINFLWSSQHKFSCYKFKLVEYSNFYRLPYLTLSVSLVPIKFFPLIKKKKEKKHCLKKAKKLSYKAKLWEQEAEAELWIFRFFSAAEIEIFVVSFFTLRFQ